MKDTIGVKVAAACSLPPPCIVLYMSLRATYLEYLISLVVLLPRHAGQRVRLEEGRRLGAVEQRLGARRGGRGGGRGAHHRRRARRHRARRPLAAPAAALAVRRPLLEEQLLLTVYLFLFGRDLLLPPIKISRRYINP